MARRINITVSDKTYELLKTLSDESGMSMSAIMNMTAHKYFEDKKVVSSLEEIESILNKLNSLNLDLGEQKK